MKELALQLVRRMNKPDYFVDAYTTLFAPLRDKPITLVEIGIDRGGSLELWRKYFPMAEIIGIDIEDKEEVPGVRIIKGDQLDPETYASIGTVDILIDDGGHTVEQQLGTLEMLYPKLRAGGLYVIEDSSTNVGTVESIKEKVHEIGKYYRSIWFLEDLIILKKV